jgi:hypothetical protein
MIHVSAVAARAPRRRYAMAQAPPLPPPLRRAMRPGRGGRGKCGSERETAQPRDRYGTALAAGFRLRAVRPGLGQIRARPYGSCARTCGSSQPATSHQQAPVSQGSRQAPTTTAERWSGREHPASPLVPKLRTRVRFPSSAPSQRPSSRGVHTGAGPSSFDDPLVRRALCTPVPGGGWRGRTDRGQSARLPHGDTATLPAVVP